MLSLLAFWFFHCFWRYGLTTIRRHGQGVSGNRERQRATAQMGAPVHLASQWPFLAGAGPSSFSCMLFDIALPLCILPF
ncbi:hypothetical protein C8R45DRAFT_988030 [Mycena sanguinolenta]|nr:hypothetical protein C8R45DRAFT_988030 [Mycena sanguinolenta]